MNSFNIKMSLFALTLMVLVAVGVVDPLTASLVGFVGAVVTVSATVITNSDATPSVINKAYLARSTVRAMRGICTSANGDNIGSTYRFGRIRSNDLVHQVFLLNATWGAACTMDIGLYKTAKDGGAVVDADFFTAAVDMNTAHLATPLNVTRGNILTTANSEKRVWEALGLTVDPQLEYDVTGTLVAAAAAAGAAALLIEVVGAN